MPLRCLLLLLLAMLLAGCSGPRHGFAPREAELVAWYVEDVAHGLDRSPDELRTGDAGQGLLRIAEWSDARAGGRELPPQLAGRRQRWPVLRTLLRRGALVVVEPGLLAVPPDASSADREIAQGTADQENQDRRTLDLMMLSLARADDPATRRFRAAVRAARLHHDLAAGGRLWGTAASTP